MDFDLLWFDPQMMGEDDPSKMPDHVWERLQEVIASEQARRERA